MINKKQFHKITVGQKYSGNICVTVFVGVFSVLCGIDKDGDIDCNGFNLSPGYFNCEIVIYDYAKSCSCFIITTFVLGYFTSLTFHA